MTLKQAYEYTLMELRKAKAPHLHLEEFNYFMNKGVQEYINIAYKTYETTQQTSDDLGAISENTSGILVGTNVQYNGLGFVGVKPSRSGILYNSSFVQFVLPDNYMHLLGIIPTISTKFNYKCYAAGYEHTHGASKLTADIGGAAIDNSFVRPDFDSPYYRIINSAGVSTIPDIQVFYGNGNKLKFKGFYLSYLKKPDVLNLTVTQRDLPIDSSQTLQFPDYVCNEIIKKVVMLQLENSQNPRLSTHTPVNKSIDNLGK